MLVDNSSMPLSIDSAEHSLPTSHLSAKFRPNRASFPRDMCENTF